MTDEECKALIEAFHKQCSWPEGDKRRGGPITPNDPATIAMLAHELLQARKLLERV